MKGFVFFILLIGAISFAHGQYESLKKEKLFIYQGCELHKQATTLCFVDSQNKQLKLLIIHPIEDSGVELNYPDFVIFNELTNSYIANPYTIRKAFRIRYAETGEIDGILPISEEELESENIN